MQIIRNKRQSSTGGAAPGQQKNKYRKRSVRASICHWDVLSLMMHLFRGLLHPASAIPATSVKHLSGVVVRTARGPCVTRAVCVSHRCSGDCSGCGSLTSVYRLCKTHAQEGQGPGCQREGTAH